MPDPPRWIHAGVRFTLRLSEENNENNRDQDVGLQRRDAQLGIRGSKTFLYAPPVAQILAGTTPLFKKDRHPRAAALAQYRSHPILKQGTEPFDHGTEFRLKHNQPPEQQVPVPINKNQGRVISRFQN